MSPEEQAQLRYLMRKGSQIPQPPSELIRIARSQRATQVERQPTIKQQQSQVQQVQQKKIHEDTKTYTKIMDRRNKSIAKQEEKAKAKILESTQDESEKKQKLKFLRKEAREARKATKQIDKEILEKIKQFKL